MRKVKQESYDYWCHSKTRKYLLGTDATYYGAWLSLDGNILCLDGYNEGCHIEISDELKRLLLKELGGVNNVLEKKEEKENI